MASYQFSDGTSSSGSSDDGSSASSDLASGMPVGPSTKERFHLDVPLCCPQCSFSVLQPDESMDTLDAVALCSYCGLLWHTSCIAELDVSFDVARAANDMALFACPRCASMKGRDTKWKPEGFKGKIVQIFGPFSLPKDFKPILARARARPTSRPSTEPH